MKAQGNEEYLVKIHHKGAKDAKKYKVDRRGWPCACPICIKEYCKLSSKIHVTLSGQPQGLPLRIIHQNLRFGKA